MKYNSKSLKQKSISVIDFLKELNQLHWFSKLNYSQNPNLLKVLNSLAHDKTYNLELRIAISVEEETVNIRYLTYFIPILELLTFFNRYGSENLFLGKISLNIIINQNLGKYIDQGVNNFETYFETNKKLIQAFIQFYYPKVMRQVKINVDDFDYQILNNKQIFTDKIKFKLKSDKIFERLVTFSMKRNSVASNEKALKYALGHTLLFGDFIKNDRGERLDAIITIGGGAEKYFNHFRESISEHIEIENYYKPLQIRLIQNNGSHPPYYTYSNDLPITNLLVSDMDLVMEHQVTNFASDFEVITKSITFLQKVKSYLYFLKKFLQTNS